jgi:glyoxylase-like metal-dependent hydrolase (beta-lactamase superfamily II)
MAKRLCVLVALFALNINLAVAQDARAVVQSAVSAMGAGNLKSIQYTGNGGWFGAFGQSFAPGENWPRTDIVSYVRTINYDAKTSREELTRRQGNNPARGGGGVPIQGEPRTVSIINGNYAWNMQGETANPAPAAAEVRQLEIWLTPPGFLKAALAASDLAAITRTETEDGMNTTKKVTAITFTHGKFKMMGQINAANELEGVQTRVPNPVLGDMLYEVRYTVYKDFGGVKFPTVMHYHNGNRYLDFGHDVMEVRVNDVKPNFAAPALPVPEAVRTATIPPVRVESQKLADGVWLIGGGSHNSVAVEFRDFVAVVEAPQNEARSIAVINEVTKLVPNKNIRYVVNTHHHFDHSGGLRTYLAHGAVVLTQQANKDFYEKVMFYPVPRYLEPDRFSTFYMRTANGAPPMIETVDQKYVLSDGRRTLELHPVANLNHAATMLLAYLPTEKILVNADLYTPAPSGQPAPALTPNMTILGRNIQRLKLDVAQHVPIHGGIGNHADFLKIVGTGSSN